MSLSRLTLKGYKYLFKNIEYVILLTILFIIVGLTLILFRKEQITYILSVLGLTFALFQFTFNHIASKKRRNYDVRYTEYKEIVKQVEGVAETISSAITSTNMNEVHSLLSKTRNQLLNLQSSINVNSNYLFLKLHETAESKTIMQSVFKLMESTDSYIVLIEKFLNNTGVDLAFLRATEPAKMQIELLNNLKEFHQNKYKFYHRLRQYFD